MSRYSFLILFLVTTSFSQQSIQTAKVDTLKGWKKSYVFINDTTRIANYVWMDSIGIPAPIANKAIFFSRGSLGLYVEYPNGTVHNLDSMNTFSWSKSGGTSKTDSIRYIDGTCITMTVSGSTLTVGVDTTCSPWFTQAEGDLKKDKIDSTANTGYLPVHRLPDSTSALRTDLARKSVTHTMEGTANEITSSAGAQDHSSNTTWTFALADPMYNHAADSTIRGWKLSISDKASYVDRQAVVTIYGQDTSSHTNYKVGVDNRILSRGDSGVTNMGAIGNYIAVIEDTTNSGTTKRKRGTMFGTVTNLVPYTENYAYAVNWDVAGDLFANLGNYEATSVFYVGGSRHMAATTGNPYSRQWRRLFELDDTVGVIFDLNGGAQDGLDLSGIDWLGDSARAIRTKGTDTSYVGYLGLGYVAHPVTWLTNYVSQPSIGLSSTLYNTNISTLAQLKDSSSFVVDFTTGTARPQITMRDNNGTAYLTTDSLNAWTLNGTSLQTSGTYFPVFSTYTLNPSSNSGARIRPLYLMQTASGNANNFTDGTYSIEAGEWTARHNGTGTAVGLVSGIFDTRNTSTGTVTNAYGIRTFVIKSSTGAITKMLGNQIQLQNTNATNAVDSGFGLYLSTYSRTGAITNAYGIYEQDTAQNFWNGDHILNGRIKRYKGIFLQTGGVPSIVVDSNRTAQSAAITATTIYAVPAAGQGKYRISYVATITTAATTSCTLGGANGFQITFTDPNDSVVKTSNPTTPVVSSTNATGTTISGVLFAYCKASTNLQYAFGYTSSGATAMQYDLSVTVEALY